MPNDDLGQFPTPPADTNTPSAQSDTSIIEDINAPAPTTISNEPFTTPPQVTPSQADTTFEETPEEIPSVAPSNPVETTPVEATPIEASPIQTPIQTTSPVTPPTPETTPAPVPPAPIVETPAASFTPKGGPSFGSLITIILLMIAGISIAGVVFLLAQSRQLRQQLSEITQTLESQKTTITPTPTPSIIEFTTPTPTPEATPTATPSITLTPTPTATPAASSLMPLLNAANALKIGLNHSPNAQLILIKTEDATHPDTAATKYFFRQDLTTKKYFYVMIVNNNEPQLVDTAIYVTPDNNIPSLNDLVLGNGLGIDLDQALLIANAQCSSGLCATATVKAQYIKSGDTLIWQLSFTPADSGKDTLVIQINAATKAVLYKSTGF